ncbi:uncharacterized protein VTP21DRAFT_5256 [Calcarisporiella thermophila]|uniref:uncharacterized protein n=1 Tax=Calcarisporiella thermophila TaxID=911321 RepID=UPI0037429AF5
MHYNRSIPRVISPPLPPSSPTPRSLLRFNPEHEQRLRRLVQYYWNFQKKREVWDELHVLDRLYYRNKSQHRNNLYWKKLCEVRRLMTRLNELDLAGKISQLHQAFYPKKQGKKMKGQWEFIPERELMFYTLHYINAGHALMQKSLDAFLKAYATFQNLLSTANFMPMALLFMSILSRMRVFIIAWKQELEELYAMLYEWVADFPEKDSRYPLKYEDLPLSLKGDLSEDQMEVEKEDASRISEPEFLKEESLPNTTSVMAARRRVLELEDIGESIDIVSIPRSFSRQGSAPTAPNSTPETTSADRPPHSLPARIIENRKPTEPKLAADELANETKKTKKKKRKRIMSVAEEADKAVKLQKTFMDDDSILDEIDSIFGKPLIPSAIPSASKTNITQQKNPSKTANPEKKSISEEGEPGPRTGAGKPRDAYSSAKPQGNWDEIESIFGSGKEDNKRQATLGVRKRKKK